MDAINPTPSASYEKALAAPKAIIAAFARDAANDLNRAEKDVILNGVFQMLVAAQKNIDEVVVSANPAGVGEKLDIGV